MRFWHLASMTSCAVALACAPSAWGQGADQQSANLNVEQLFATSCGWCHQNGGRTAGRGPKLASSDKSDDYIINQIKNGKMPGMPAFRGIFNDAQIQAIVGYIRGLKDEP
jgi:mono/diheme cytochrome c family protein